MHIEGFMTSIHTIMCIDVLTGTGG